MTPHVTSRGLYLGMITLGLGLALGCGNNKHGGAPPAEVGPARAPAITVERSEPLPPLVRDLLTERMHHNLDQLSFLHVAVLSVDHDAARDAARAILGEPRLSRPTPEAGETINEEIPTEFFALQQQMVDATRRVEAAAVARDDQALSDAYGELTAACVACHSVYLRIPPASP